MRGLGLGGGFEVGAEVARVRGGLGIRGILYIRVARVV